MSSNSIAYLVDYASFCVHCRVFQEAVHAEISDLGMDCRGRETYAPQNVICDLNPARRSPYAVED